MHSFVGAASSAGAIFGFLKGASWALSFWGVGEIRGREVVAYGKSRGGVSEELRDTGPVVDWSFSGLLCDLRGSFTCC